MQPAGLYLPSLEVLFLTEALPSGAQQALHNDNGGGAWWVEQEDEWHWMQQPPAPARADLQVAREDELSATAQCLQTASAAVGVGNESWSTYGFEHRFELERGVVQAQLKAHLASHATSKRVLE